MPDSGLPGTANKKPGRADLPRLILVERERKYTNFWPQVKRFQVPEKPQEQAELEPSVCLQNHSFGEARNFGLRQTSKPRNRQRARRFGLFPSSAASANLLFRAVLPTPRCSTRIAYLGDP
jgi:hypothetical protein